MDEIYVLEGERGEYEGHTQSVYGVFTTLGDARRSIATIPATASAGWDAYCAFEQKASAIAAAEGAPAVETYLLDQSDEEREAWLRHAHKVTEVKERLGGEPSFICEADRYWITKFKLGAVGVGEVVFDTDETQHAI